MNETRIRNAVINYMSDPEFINNDFIRQLTLTDAELQVYNVKEAMLYFSVPKKDFDSLFVLNNLCNNLAIIEFGKESGGRVNLGKYSLLDTAKHFFRLSTNDFKIDISRVISLERGGYTYTISLPELADYSDNIVIYGGPLDLLPDILHNPANHGAFVAKNNEPSLKRLTDRIILNENNKEPAAQKLLEFVSSGIKFNNKEAIGNYEILKRPNEVLMSGTSDCSGLTILYASLLEQAEIDYILVYYSGHITVGVSGNFPEENGLSFEHSGKKYFIAETTANDFIIGKSRLLNINEIGKIKYLQKPGTNELLNY